MRSALQDFVIFQLYNFQKPLHSLRDTVRNNDRPNFTASEDPQYQTERQQTEVNASVRGTDGAMKRMGRMKGVL